MVQMEGKYTHERNENLDEYFKSVGMPYIPRKMALATSPAMEIKVENEEWIITISTMLRTVVSKFKLGEDYEENMPGGVIKSKTIVEDDKLVTSSIGPDGTKLSRTYEFNDKQCIITYKNEQTGVTGKRYFKRA